ncbi:MAG: hypothetical protein GEV13_35135 [Rhodospirillales bacterium]|nr:hypothetical protein [Rhodospirillales bacterium]
MPAKHADLLSQDQILSLQLGSRLKERSENSKNKPKQIGHRATILRCSLHASTPNRIFSTHRLIGSIRRECLDHVVVLGEAQLRRILAAYAGYYNGFRTHLFLDKDTPSHRPSSGSASSLLSRSSADFIIIIAGYSLR